jgi:hypothetical protein
VRIQKSKSLKIVKNWLELRKLQPSKMKRVRTQKKHITKICQKWIRIEKVMALQNRGSENSKKQTTKHYKAHSWSPKKLLVCCSIAISTQRLFVQLKVGLL